MQPDGMEIPRIIIAALRGGSGKTILSIGFIAALTKLDTSIAPFKKGPDYIDAGWLALAAGRPCYNLDSFLLSQEDNFHSFLHHSKNCDLSVIEGNRGLFDGIDLEGSTSTAELAKLLECPVVLCVDCTKITRTMAAVVMGCTLFDPDVMVKAVILNRVANSRHEKKLRNSIEHYCGIPILGAIPKLDQQHFPERHLGLVPTPEHDWATDAIEAISQIAEQHIDLNAILKISRKTPLLATEVREQRTENRKQSTEIRSQRSEVKDWNGEWGMGNAETKKQRMENDVSYRESSIIDHSGFPLHTNQHPVSSIEKSAPTIGIIRDSAFQFYYPENIDALSKGGAEVVFVSPLKDRELPGLDALYIGGGFPETHADHLANNESFSRQLKDLAEDGLPIYAECGGLMYLGEKLLLEDKAYSMVGILPLVFAFYKKPQGHGYAIVTVEGQNPYYDVGSEIKGHEFHYSRVSNWTGSVGNLVFRMRRGTGISQDRDG
ncbi:MAG: cobyrinate a,c-diamide synthase, partial [Desulfobacterales bacterium]